MTNEERLSELQHAVTAAETQQAKIEALNLLGNTYFSTGNNFKAIECFCDALSLNEGSGDKSSIARLKGNLGNVYYSLGDYIKSLEYMNAALGVFEELGEKSRVALVTGNIGNIYSSLGDYTKSLEYFSRSLAEYEELNDNSGIALLTGNLGTLYYSLGNYIKALEYFNQALAVFESLGEKSRTANIMGNIGSTYLSLSEHTKSLEFLNRSLAIFEELGEKSKIALVIGNIGNLYSILCDYNNALEYFNRSLAIHVELGEKPSIAVISGNIGGLLANKDFDSYDLVKAEEYLLKATALSEKIGFKQSLYTSYQALAELYQNQKRWEEAFHFHKKYHDVEKEVLNEEAKKLADKQDLDRKLAIERAAANERNRILDNILPSQITERLIKGEQPIADRAEHVSVFFSDIIGFTTLSQKITAKELVSGLNELFIQYDILAKKHGLEKIKTIGDAYMAVCGVPVFMENHAARTANFALGIQELFKNGITIAGHNVQVRIGLHCGEVIAGVIGEQKFAYDLWGDAVNTASRMESHGEAGKIHVSEDFVRELKTNSEQQKVGQDGQQLITINSSLLTVFRRGEMEIKGKGMMKTYFLEKKTF